MGGIFGKGKEPKEKDWGIITAVTFVVGVILLKILGEYVENFPLNVKTFIFIIAIGLILFGVITILRYKISPVAKENLGYFIVWIIVIAAIVFFLIRFKIVPSFTLVGTQLASVIGI